MKAGMLANKPKNTVDAMMAQAAPVSIPEAQRLARDFFGLTVAESSPLDSEKDQNFHLRAGDGREYILKITNPGEDRQVTNLQTEALLHIAAVDSPFPVPGVFPDLRGLREPLVAFADGTSRVVRLLSYMPGIPLHKAAGTAIQRQNLGKTLARLTRALRGFSHPAAGHEMMWDIKHAGQMRPLLAHIREKDKRALADGILKNFEEKVQPVLSKLRAQVVHNDFNPYNILVEAENHDVVAGVIDFGDCVHTQLVNDLAIACAYHLDGAWQPLDFVAEIVGAYHKNLPLEKDEIDILFDLISTRLMMGVCINGWRAALYPENAAYILSNNARAWNGLERLSRLPREEAQGILRRACGGE